jgi:hypothetical protein
LSWCASRAGAEMDGKVLHTATKKGRTQILHLPETAGKVAERMRSDGWEVTVEP